jgi:hypothetical protein
MNRNADDLDGCGACLTPRRIVFFTGAGISTESASRITVRPGTGRDQDAADDVRFRFVRIRRPPGVVAAPHGERVIERSS